MKKNLLYVSLSLSLFVSISACNAANDTASNTANNTANNTKSIAENKKPLSQSKPKPQTITNSHKHSDNPDAETLRTQLEKIRNEIDTLIGSAKCSNNKQCQALAIGHKACGGPITYIPYSTENTDTKKLIKLSEKHQQKNKELNKVTGMMSDCRMVMQPTFICQDNRCQK